MDFNFKEIASGKLVVTHAQSGWTTGEVAIKYLRWVAEYFNGTMDWPDVVEEPDDEEEEEEAQQEVEEGPEEELNDTLWDQITDDAGELQHSVCVLWDLYAAHRDRKVKKNSPVHLEWIPAGLTDQFQPLDRRIFGSLKSSARARMDTWLRRHSLTEMDWTIPIKLLLEAWAGITEEEVKKAWSHFITYNSN